MKRYNVRAERWAEGWELHIDGLGVTQVRTLDRAHQQVADYVETVTDSDEEIEITLSFELGGLEDKVAEARRMAEEAARLQAEAAALTRVVVHALRDDQHLSVTDTAAVLGVSRGRVSQLVS